MPPVKCGGCAKYLSPTEAATCRKCKSTFHRACVSLPPKVILSPSWQCRDCKKKNPIASQVDENTSDEFMDSCTIDVTAEIQNSTSSIIAVELQRFRDEMRAEFRAMRQEFKQALEDSLKAYHERVDKLEDRVSALEKTLSNASDTPSISIVVAQLKTQINDRDQELLGNDIEIANIPETKEECVIHTVKLISNKLGVQLEDRDIVSADRIGGNHISATNSAGPTNLRPRRIVVRLARRELRDELLRNARIRKGTTTADIDTSGPPRRFYINERLTKLNHQLFRSAREAGSRHGWQFIWTKRGRILARKKNGDAVSLIKSEEDLLRVFGS